MFTRPLLAGTSLDLARYAVPELGSLGSMDNI